ncbi:MAG: DUF421 domain-containing protein [Oscillospiraceae bacterium]|nr:DUF421 domain-containing protein [Candidatus Equicaccousia limihippi]
MIKLLIRTVVCYVVLILGVRLMGKRQIGDLQPNELVITLLISELAAISLQDLGQPLSISLITIFILVFLEVLVSVLSTKLPWFKKICSGKPIVLIKNGEIDQKAANDVRLSPEDILQLLHAQGIFDIHDVYRAVFEVNGTLSVQSYAEKMPLCSAGNKNSLPVVVISNGKIVTSAADFLGLTEKQITDKAGHRPQDVFMMSLDEHGKMNIVLTEDVK